VRQSFCFRPEKEFGKPNTYTQAEIDAGADKWIAVPPGSFINTTHNRGAARINTAGSKIWDTVAYGQLTGSFEWTFMLDYNYLEPFYFLFEDFSETANEHVYAKKNNGRIKSFTIRRKMLNTIAGGPEGMDEMEDVYGCVARNLSFSKAAGSSQISVRITGFFVDERMVTGTLEATDYTEYRGELAEFLCMFVGDNASDTLADCDYVANTDSLEISIENNSEAIYNTCSPFASQYYEGITNYAFSTSCYSNNPDHYKRRVYTGGNTLANRPLSKGMKPLAKIILVAYNSSAREYDTTSGEPPVTTHVEDYDVTAADIKAAVARSSKTLTFDISQCVIRSLTWPKGDGSKIMDNISSAECRKITMTVKNAGYVADPTDYESSGIRNRITSEEPTSI